MRKAQHLQPKASDVADAEVGCFAFSRLAAHIRVLSKSGEKPTLPAKRSVGVILKFYSKFIYYLEGPEGPEPALGSFGACPSVFREIHWHVDAAHWQAAARAAEMPPDGARRAH